MINIKIMNFLVIFLSLFILEDCRETTILETTEENNPQNIQLDFKNVVYDKPLNISNNIAIDAQGKIWYKEVRADTSVHVPPYSSTIPSLTRICKFNGTKHYIMYDNFKKDIYQIAFDKNRNIWLLGPKEIMKINSSHVLSTVLEINDINCMFQTITVDQDNNIWIGGFNTGIYKFRDKEWLNYTTNNSQLPTNSINKIYIDKNNNIWIALWYMEGLLKINNNNNWTIYNRLNSPLTQQVRDMTTDNNGNLWIGTGWENPDVTVMKFDGMNWMVNNPKDREGKNIPGVVERILTDNMGRIWTLSAEIKNLVGVRTTLSILDGVNWKIIKDAADNNYIHDMKVYKNKIFLATNSRIYVIQ